MLLFHNSQNLSLSPSLELTPPLLNPQAETVIGVYSQKCFPYFQKMKLKGSLIFIFSLMHTYFSNHSDWFPVRTELAFFLSG